jgi:transcriptional antiterminator
VSENGDRTKAQRLGIIFNKLLKADPMKGDKVSQKYLCECLDCTRQTVASDLTLAIKYRLVKSQRGHGPMHGWEGSGQLLNSLGIPREGFHLDLPYLLM